VKIAPAYEGPTVHVVDASRAVGTVGVLLDTRRREDFLEANVAKQAHLREVHADRTRAPLVALPKAIENRMVVDWAREEIPVPSFTGRRVLEADLEILARYIDWTFFFTAWGLRGKFPGILDDPAQGKAARDLFENAQALLRKIIAEGGLLARGVYGFWPAAADGEDVVVYSGEARATELTRFACLRQQQLRTDGKPNYSLADFLAPVGSSARDYLGAFAVTAGIGERELSASYEKALDDYHAIMVKALADRLAEAFAEHLHAQARRDWGYETGTTLSNEELIAEKYRGIRPAFGYPACPDHSEKEKLFALLDAREVGISLTESFAMLPAASVSGIYFSHPKARYFNVGRIERDQVVHYAKRKGMSVREVERWLASNLAYDPE
jgi:5-methyltetrahydrofolate--homocysteine methyltransferase